MTDGYVMTPRREFDADDFLWSENRPRTRWEAWRDLTQMAAFRDGAYYSTSSNGGEVLARGEFVASLRYLGKRWQWDKMKVSRLCLALEKAGRIVRQRESAIGTVYLIVEYDRYSGVRDTSETAGETANETLARQRRDKEEEGKKVKKETTLGASDAAPAEASPPKRDAYPPEFEACWQAYPKRPNHSKRDAFKAWRARVRDGDDPSVLLAGTVRYAAYCDAAGKAGTEWVKQAATFYGPGGHYLLEWEVTPSLNIVRPGSGAQTASGNGNASPADRILGALDVAGLTREGMNPAEYRRRVLDVAESVGYEPGEFYQLVKAIKPWDLARHTFEPDRRREFAQRLAYARQQVAA